MRQMEELVRRGTQWAPDGEMWEGEAVGGDVQVRGWVGARLRGQVPRGHPGGDVRPFSHASMNQASASSIHSSFVQETVGSIVWGRRWVWERGWGPVSKALNVRTRSLGFSLWAKE